MKQNPASPPLLTLFSILPATKNSVVASVLGSLAAAVECEHEGNVPVRPKDVVDKLHRFERFMNYQ